MAPNSQCRSKPGVAWVLGLPHPSTRHNARWGCVVAVSRVCWCGGLMCRRWRLGVLLDRWNERGQTCSLDHCINTYRLGTDPNRQDCTASQPALPQAAKGPGGRVRYPPRYTEVASKGRSLDSTRAATTRDIPHPNGMPSKMSRFCSGAHACRWEARGKEARNRRKHGSHHPCSLLVTETRWDVSATGRIHLAEPAEIWNSNSNSVGCGYCGL